MNHVTLIGRLTKDPSITYAQNGDNMAIARYTLAVDRRGKKQEGQHTADFISCVAFKNNAEFAEKYLRQGTKIAVEGRIQTGSYKNRDGQTVYTTDVVIDSQEFCEGKKETQDNAPSRPELRNVDGDGFMNIPDDVDADLPFN